MAEIFSTSKRCCSPQNNMVSVIRNDIIMDSGTQHCFIYEKNEFLHFKYNKMLKPPLPLFPFFSQRQKDKIILISKRQIFSQGIQSGMDTAFSRCCRAVEDGKLCICFFFVKHFSSCLSIGLKNIMVNIYLCVERYSLLKLCFCTTIMQYKGFSFFLSALAPRLYLCF